MEGVWERVVTRGPLVVLCTAPLRGNWPNGLGGPSLLTIEASALRKHSERMECRHSEQGVFIKSETSVGCCVLSRKDIRVWKPRGGSRDGLVYCHS